MIYKLMAQIEAAIDNDARSCHAVKKDSEVYVVGYEVKRQKYGDCAHCFHNDYRLVVTYEYQTPRGNFRRDTYHFGDDDMWEFVEQAVRALAS